MTARQFLVIFVHAVAGWLLCGATIGVAMATTTIDKALVIHAVLAPLYFVGITLIYCRAFNYTRPLVTAILFTVIVMLLDFFVVALLVYGNLVMFESALGTWIPFASIFVATYLTGLAAAKPR